MKLVHDWRVHVAYLGGNNHMYEFVTNVPASTIEQAEQVAIATTCAIRKAKHIVKVTACTTIATGENGAAV